MARPTGQRSREDSSDGDGAVARMLQFPGLEPAVETTRLANPARRSDVDEWGRSERWRRVARRARELLLPQLVPRGVGGPRATFPATGGALLVANHAGALPSDAPMIMQGIEEGLGRPVYGLADNFFRTIPAIGTGWSRTGGVPAHPDNAHRILHDHEQLALVFPEGVKGPSKLASERYRLRRFGRGGFVESAMRAGVPVVPIAVVGAEESMPILFRLPAAAKVLKLPYLPITVNHLLLGPVLGSVVYLPAKFRFRVLRAGSFRRHPRPCDNIRAAASWTRPRRSANSCRRPSSTCSRTAAASGSADVGRRILLTGLDTFWGGRVAAALEQDPEVEMLLGMGTGTPSVQLERTEYVRADSSYSLLSRIVQATQVDTIVHTFLVVDSSSMSGRALHEINVIGTMNLLAAAGAANSSVRQVVVKSSAVVYGTHPSDPGVVRGGHSPFPASPLTPRAVAHRGRELREGLRRARIPASRSHCSGSPTCSARRSRHRSAATSLAASCPASPASIP